MSHNGVYVFFGLIDRLDYRAGQYQMVADVNLPPFTQSKTVKFAV